MIEVFALISFLGAIFAVIYSVKAKQEIDLVRDKIEALGDWQELVSMMNNLTGEIDLKLQEVQDRLKESDQNISKTSEEVQRLLKSLAERSREADAALQNLERYTESISKPGAIEKYRVKEIEGYIELGMNKEEIAEKLQVPLGEVELLMKLHLKK